MRKHEPPLRAVCGSSGGGCRFQQSEGHMRLHSRATQAIIAVGLVITVVCAASATAQDKADATGTWQVRVSRPGRPASESTLKLQKTGGKIVGVMMDAQGRST